MHANGPFSVEPKSQNQQPQQGLSQVFLEREDVALVRR